MTDKQKQEVLEILSKDCQHRFYYRALDNPNLTCAIGALARAAGVSDDVLIAASVIDIMASPYGKDEPRRAVVTMREAIQAKFGLTKGQLNHIQQLNDGISEDWRRAIKVCDLVSTFLTEEGLERAMEDKQP